MQREIIVKKVTKNEVTFEEHCKAKQGKFFQGAQPGQVWKVTYEGDSMWSKIIEAKQKIMKL